MSEDFVYKLLAEDDWAKAMQAGVTRTALDVGDGYVHLSTRDQVAETARLHYAQKTGTRLLKFAVSDLPPLEWEPSRGGQLFPHLYADLHVEKAEAMWVLMLDPSGVPMMPEGL